MKKERQSKRRRSTEDDNRYPDVVVSAVSADQPSSLQVEQPIFADNYLPTPRDISNLLGKIDDHHSSQQVGAALEALNQLNEWSKKEEIRSTVLEFVFCFGGIARVLDFLNSNMQNRNCVIGSTEFLSFILSFRWNALEVNKNLAIEMAAMIVRVSLCVFVYVRVCVLCLLFTYVRVRVRVKISNFFFVPSFFELLLNNTK
jgi:hypothetical protein